MKDEVNPEKAESMMRLWDIREKARREGRLVEIPVEMDDEVNPRKLEQLRADAEAYEKAAHEGRLVDVPLTAEQRRPMILEDGEGDGDDAT